MVINFDFYDKLGFYWVCLYLNGNKVEYFDFYELFFILKFIKEFMDRNGYYMIYNKNCY